MTHPCSETILEVDRWLALGEPLQRATCRGLIGGMDEGNEELFEQLGLREPEGWRKRRREALEAPVAADDREQTGCA